MKIITRKEARANGLSKYFTGKPCKHGHIAERYTGRGGCTECIREASKSKETTKSDVSLYLHYNSESGQFHWKCRPDNESFNRVYSGRQAGNVFRPKNSRTEYIRIRVDNRLHTAHRLAWLLYYGEWPKGHIDHIDGNGLNNAISNLRIVTSKDNSRNCRLSKNNKTGVNGVWCQAGRYVAEIMVDRKKISLGSFGTLEEAKAARKAADKIYGFFDGHGERRE